MGALALAYRRGIMLVMIRRLPSGSYNGPSSRLKSKLPHQTATKFIMIGIDAANRLIYEGATHYGYGVWPAPFIGPATLIADAGDWPGIPNTVTFGPRSFVFREDSFDAVTRIKRGRIYQAGDSQPIEWHVQQHPAYHEEVGNRDQGGRFRKMLDTFHISRLSRAFTSNPDFIVAIGAGDAVSLWSVLLVERNFIGEDVLTLRARSTLGVLPPLAAGRVPPEALSRVTAALEAVADTAYRAGATSVIDRCRDAAQVVLAEWFAQHAGEPAATMPDLSALAAKIETKRPECRVIVSAARIIARLHARGKPNEQVRLDVRPPIESDASVAIELVGLLLHEVGWSRSV